MIITAVPQEQVPMVWDKASKLLQKATDTTGPRFGVFDIFDGLLGNKLALWLVFEEGEKDPIAAFTTRIIQYNGCKSLAIDWVGGGKMRHWLPESMNILKRFAKDNGCSRLEGYGRRAWGRVLARDGWEPEYTAYKLELNDE